MKRNSIIYLPVFALAMLVVTSCLNQNDQNLPPGAGGGSLLMLDYKTGAGSANTNAGLTPAFFSDCALLFPTDTLANFAVTVQGPVLSKDVHLTLGIDTTKAHRWDNLANDSIYYLPMPAAAWSLTPTTAVLKAGETYTSFQLRIDPTQLNGKKSYMLPITVTNSDGVLVADNFKWIYAHTIGNPLAGPVTWDFVRCSDPACAGGPDGLSFTGHSTSFAPISGTSFSVPTGYYDGGPYIVTFNDDGLGTPTSLTGFKAVIDPNTITNSWTPAGISIATGPIISVTNSYTKFVMHYTTATRNCTDTYNK